MFDFPSVTEKCCVYLERQLTTQNCLDMHRLADTHSFEILREKSMACLLKNFMDVYQQVPFSPFFLLLIILFLSLYQSVRVNSKSLN